jgi:diguanylate cyclase (GGDEF)-like protein
VRSRTRKLDLVFRMGGEEFLVLMPETTETDAAAVAEQIRQAIAMAPLLDGQKVTVSIGVGGLRMGDSVDGWVRDTDSAMYEAKEAGRDRVERRAAAVAEAP